MQAAKHMGENACLISIQGHQIRSPPPQSTAPHSKASRSVPSGLRWPPDSVLEPESTRRCGAATSARSLGALRPSRRRGSLTATWPTRTGRIVPAFGYEHRFRTEKPGMLLRQKVPDQLTTNGPLRGPVRLVQSTPLLQGARSRRMTAE